MDRITAEMLEEHNACADQLAEFSSRFPDGVTFESEDDAAAKCAAVASVFDWEWAADNLLTTPARDAYETAIAPAWDAYQTAKAPARDAYQTAIAAAGDAYQTAIAPARDAYQTAMAAAWDAYQTAIAPAWDACQTAMAAAFATAFWDYGE